MFNEDVTKTSDKPQAATHTPGPWVLRGKSSLEEHTLVVLAQDPNVRHGAIAHVFEHPSFEGDSALISAAPDLLAALKQHVQIGAWALEALRELSPEKYEEVMRMACKTVVTLDDLPGARAFAAIRKAERPSHS